MPVISGGGGGGGGAMTLLSSTVLGASATSFDFQNIAGTFSHLWIVCYLRGDGAFVGNSARLRFNNDSAANYDTEQTQGVGTAATASTGTAAATSLFISELTGANATANEFTVASAFIPQYAGTTGLKAVVLTSGAVGTQGTLSEYANDVASGSWRSTAAITRVTIIPGSGTNFVAGSAVTLYGMQ